LVNSLRSVPNLSHDDRLKMLADLANMRYGSKVVWEAMIGDIDAEAEVAAADTLLERGLNAIRSDPVAIYPECHQK
jgi:hypothetical protein